MREITVQELKDMQDNNEDFQLVDVREPDEYEVANLNGELIPLGQILQEHEKISREKKVVIHCRSGARSGNAVQLLEQQHGLDNLYNLKGGIRAYSMEIDPSIPLY